MRIVSRSPNRYSTTFPTEVVTCEIGSGTTQRLFCKYFSARPGESYGKSASPFYEIDVYRKILATAPLPLPRFLGAWIDRDLGAGLLVLEYLEGSRRLAQARDAGTAMKDAARWIGEFHRSAASLAVRPETGFLLRRDGQFHRDCCKRLVENSGGWREEHPWLGPLSDRFEQVLSLVEDATPTVIHGEYYTDNILVQDGRIFPVDWETASIGMGEMDLVALVDRWPSMSDRCINAYAEARGIIGDRRDLLRRFTVGQMLINVYWLSYCGSQAVTEKQRLAAINRRFEQLRNSAQQLGVL